MSWKKILQLHANEEDSWRTQFILIKTKKTDTDDIIILTSCDFEKKV